MADIQAEPLTAVSDRDASTDSGWLIFQSSASFFVTHSEQFQCCVGSVIS